MKRGIAFFLLVFACAVKLHAQKLISASSLDSLIKVTLARPDDTTKLKRLMGIWQILEHRGRLDTSLYFLKQAQTIAVKLNNQDQLANIASSYGDTYLDLGFYPQALESYMQSLKIGQQIKSDYYVANATCNMGLIYYSTNEYDKALEYYSKALKMDEQRHDSTNITAAETDVGEVYFTRKNYPEALMYFRKCLAIDSIRKFYSGIGPDLDNIGTVYLAQNQYDSAIFYFEKAISEGERIVDVLAVSQFEADLGEAYLKMKKYDKAEKALLAAKAMADSARTLDNTKRASQLLSELYSEKKEWKKAYEYFEIYQNSKDSLFNAAKSKEIGKLEAKAGYDKQLAVQKADIDKKEAVAGAESKHQKIVIGLISTIALAVGLIAIIILRSLRVARKQKEIIEVQKKQVEDKKRIVEEKNGEILDSIAYAKRLQDAILPPLTEIKKYLPDSFVLYKPKAIVAGDFYWMEKRGDSVFVAACDCTGHGVPGAMVSVVCSNSLNRAVKEFGINDPGKILDKTRELVLETFEKSGGEIKDGMDISLASLSPSKGGTIVRWAGAYNGLWYMKNNELLEVVADKQPIGKVDNPKKFTTHTLELEKGDNLYLLTDGYADQFGGPRGKKYKYKQLLEKIKAISKKAMEEQNVILDREFEQWKDMQEQTDDVCVIGIRL